MKIEFNEEEIMEIVKEHVVAMLYNSKNKEISASGYGSITIIVEENPAKLNDAAKGKTVF